MAIDLTTIATEALKQTPAILIAAGGLIWQIRRNVAKLEKNQEEMKTQLDGHTKLLRKASRAQGILEGHERAKQEVKQDLVDVVKTVKTAQKRRARKDDKS